MHDIAAIVAARQHQRLVQALGRRWHSSETTAQPSSWRHVPLDELFGAHNTLYPRGNGLLESGHEPLHTSKGGRCVLVDTTAGRWWCRSCRQHGDAATFVMAINGWPHSEATRWLAAQYGQPAECTVVPVHSPARRRGRRGRARWREL
jgi:hypothetical protein